MYLDAKKLSLVIQSLTPGPVVLIALARGGWIPTRVLATVFEEKKIDSNCFSLSTKYIEIGTPQEHVIISQGLDSIAIKSLKESLNTSYNLWIIDAPYLMGNTASVARMYVRNILKNNDLGNTPIHIGVLHWVTFNISPKAPWRKNAVLPPDAYGRFLKRDIKPYLIYPWEHSDFEKIEKH